MKHRLLSLLVLAATIGGTVFANWPTWHWVSNGPQTALGTPAHAAAASPSPNIISGEPRSPSGAIARRSPTKPLPGYEPSAVEVDQVNLNTATAEELGFLPGIGPSRAAAILRHRQAHPFTHSFQIMKIRGIGRKTFKRLKPHLTVSGPTTLTHPIRRSSTSEEPLECTCPPPPSCT